MMKIIIYTALIVFFWLPIPVSAQQTSDTVPYREYRFLFGHPEEMDIVAAAGVSLNKAFSDIYFRGLGKKVPEKISPITETVWGVFWTFMFSLWPHEFGHKARARQVGGDFIIQSFGLPFPTVEMKIPETVDSIDGILPSIGGHEINNLMVQQAHGDFYLNQYAFADELIHAFIQEVYYPFYAFVIMPRDPEESDTWINTMGDPSESALLVYRNYTGKPAVRSDDSVDPELIRQYRETVYASLVWTLLDPMLYVSTRAFAADMKKDRGRMRPWMLGNKSIGWMWGTRFNPSPLGYELYLHNYLRLKNKLYRLYIKYGRPYKNLGTGIGIPALIQKGNITLGASGDFWIQDLFGTGGAAYLTMDYRIYKSLGVILTGGWKSRGYLLGKRLEESALVLAGFKFRF
jgi:hypothetical protein